MQCAREKRNTNNEGAAPGHGLATHDNQCDIDAMDVHPLATQPLARRAVGYGKMGEEGVQDTPRVWSSSLIAPLTHDCISRDAHTMGVG